MKIRQTVKKAVALGTGALMLGATILGASAANVSDYPTAFIKDGKVNAKIVVGEKAQAIDIVGAIDIAADLQANAVSKTTVSTTGTGVSVTGGKTKEIALNSTLSDFGTLKHAKVTGLLDSKITWNDKDLDVEETLDVTKMKVMVSEQDSDFGTSPMLGTPSSNGIVYKYVIDDADLDITTVSKEDSLKVDILGKSIEVINASTGTANQVIVSTANEYYMNAGDSVTVDGKKVKLVRVSGSGSGAAVVDVDGVIDTVSGTTSKKVNGIRVEAVSYFGSDNLAEGAASLKIGEKITETIKDGDSMELFGEPSKETDAEWVWDISSSTGNKDYLSIGARFNQNYDTDTEPVKKMGEKFSLPNNYASVYMDSLTAKADADITYSWKDGFKIGYYENATAIATGLATYDDGKALVIESNKDIFKVNVSGQPSLIETNTIYYVYDADNSANAAKITSAFKNSDGDVQIFDTNAGVLETVGIEYDSSTGTVGNIALAGNTSAVQMVTTTFTGPAAAASSVALNASFANKRFGANDDGYVSGDYVVTGMPGIDKDSDYLTSYGMIVKAVEAQLDNEKFQITIPSEQVKMNVVVVGKDGSAASGASGSVTTDKVNPVGVDFAVLDKDFTAGTANSIVVGGPCVNTAAAALMGNPANCAEGFAEGEAKLAVFADGSKVALIVAGYSGADTLAATRALVTSDLPAKSSAKVITTNVKNPTVE